MKFAWVLFISFKLLGSVKIEYQKNIFYAEIQFADCRYSHDAEILFEVDLMDPKTKEVSHKEYYNAKYLFKDKKLSNPIHDSGTASFHKTIRRYLGEINIDRRTTFELNKKSCARVNDFEYDPRIHELESPARSMRWKVTLLPSKGPKGKCSLPQYKMFEIKSVTGAYNSLPKIFRSKNTWVQESRFAFDKRNRTVKASLFRNEEELEIISDVGGVFRYQDIIDHNNSSSYPTALYNFSAERANGLKGSVQTSTFPLMCVSGWACNYKEDIDNYKIEFVLNHVRTPGNDNMSQNEVFCDGKPLGQIDLTGNYTNSNFFFEADDCGKYNCYAIMRHRDPDLSTQVNWEVIFLPVF